MWIPGEEHDPEVGWARSTGRRFFSAGTYTRDGRKWAIDWAHDCLVVSELDWRARKTFRSVRFTPFDALVIVNKWSESMASKWIAAAIAKIEGGPRVTIVDEPVLYKNRPAIYEFMTESESAPGVPRELSVLMITVCNGGLRIGMRDDDAGGWLWRQEASLAKALDAIEKALQSGTVDWSRPGAKSKKR